MPYQVSMMGWVGLGPEILGWVGFWKSDPWPILLHPRCLFFAVVWRRTSSDAAFRDSVFCFLSCMWSDFVIIGHVNRSFYLLTYWLTYLRCDAQLSFCLCSLHVRTCNTLQITTAAAEVHSDTTPVVLIIVCAFFSSQLRAHTESCRNQHNTCVRVMFGW